MALHWDITEMGDEAKTDDNWTVTDALIWYTMFVGIGQITESNAAKMAERVGMHEQAFGAIVSVPDGADGYKSHRITLADVRLRIGLRTNASNWTDAAFRKHVIDRLQSEAEQRVRREAAMLSTMAAEAAAQTAAQ